ncbi:5-oxoprolinase [Aspergillus sclerotialis]|uniref:5-oxoprolinase n=1 Tax=Aspergillus sclerotialis TaxID=2070753 RepID=A0A3A2ZMU8_9EURO|nr:5-oxoprolinase [Aspergillus sclerotialis]
MSSNKIKISIDRGGTFTDVHAIVPGKPDIVLKLLSVDPTNYQDAPTEGIRRVLEAVTGETLPRGKPLRLDDIECLRMGTTVATNALLERKGTRFALLTTRGFRDLLRIGNQARPDIFDLSAKRPDALFEQVVEVDERIIPSHPRSSQEALSSFRSIEGITGEKFHVARELDTEKVTADLQALKDQGYRSIAVALINSFACPDHELKIGEIASKLGFSVSLSSQLQPMIKVVPRGMSATADAYLTPVIKSYIDSISPNFEGGLGSHGCRVEFMQSDGGLVDFRQFSGLKAILSGPAAGVVGYASTSWDEKARVPIIGFDMGGTSTDVSRFDGHLDHTFSSTISGVSIQAPQLDINTVAAGGGSILFWRNGLFMVGPESASAHPGPACYRKGGPLTVTDANLFLGRLLPEYFPKIFGPNEDQPLDREITRKLFEELTQQINLENDGTQLTPEQVALGFLKVADESMTRPIRNLTEARGFETSNHHLASFGGAGGQHACNVAASLNISRIIIHKHSSILSAYGLALAEIVHEAQEPMAANYVGSEKLVASKLQDLIGRTTEQLRGQGFTEKQLRHDIYLNMRYEGSDTSLMILKPEDGDFLKTFVERHRREFNFTFERPVLIDDVRVRTTASSNKVTEKSPLQQLNDAKLKEPGPPTKHADVYFDAETGFRSTPIYQLRDLGSNVKLHGPAIIIDETQTIVANPNASVHVLESCVLIDLESGPRETTHSTKSTLFMGRTLQKTAVSTNIKERLDFSCALFSPDGGLVANAPHVPVHLGSMQFAVRYQHKRWQGKLKDGDVLVSNHPVSGGTHLPDVTVVTPVFKRGTDEIIFYVASRGHHADIGGILPGSMPPNSTELWQEGAAIESEKVVSNGVFNDDRMRELFLEIPSKYEGCSGSRNLSDNISDLKAQIAANARGIALIQNLVEEYGLETVQMYMYEIQRTAELAVRNLLKDMYDRYGGQPMEVLDFMDDGTPIKLTLTIDKKGSAIFDFNGTGPEVRGNINAPEAITHSAIIYVLRCMINSDVPLNQGCLNPVEIRIPKPSILSPTGAAAVVGGNVTTSQRVTDVVLKALHACAASQGCLNNLTFGIDAQTDENGNVKQGFGYYETIAGGAGAGDNWVGESGVHVHMTNTRITDPEVLEKRYPCILRRFELRENTGGAGRNRGGDGVAREIEFLTPVQCSILSERRVHRPYGMEGGEPGEAGLNLWLTKDKYTGQDRKVNMGGKGSVPMKTGDRVVIMTPGGGGYGTKEVVQNGIH